MIPMMNNHGVRLRAVVAVRNSGLLFIRSANEFAASELDSRGPNCKIGAKALDGDKRFAVAKPKRRLTSRRKGGQLFL